MLDNVTISKNVSHPDIISTMTANPKYKKITGALLPRRTSPDRRNICFRVFQPEPEALVLMVNNDDLFENTAACVRIIDSQKRRLPRAHCTLFLDRESIQLLEAAHKEDMIMSTEIPGDYSQLQKFI